MLGRWVMMGRLGSWVVLGRLGRWVVMCRPRSWGKSVMDRQAGGHRPDPSGRTQSWKTIDRLCAVWRGGNCCRPRGCSSGCLCGSQQAWRGWQQPQEQTQKGPPLSAPGGLSAYGGAALASVLYMGTGCLQEIYSWVMLLPFLDSHPVRGSKGLYTPGFTLVTEPYLGPVPVTSF